MAMDLEKKYKEEFKENYKKKGSNVMDTPRLLKIVINRGLGEATSNSKVIEVSFETLWRISGQKPVLTKAKKSISNFKVREGQILGCKVTLRRKKMYDFLTKLLHVSLPKIRDFRGVSARFDKQGNYTLGVKEDLIFPEVRVESLDKSRGFDVTFVTNCDSKEESKELLAFFGMPFRK